MGDFTVTKAEFEMVYEKLKTPIKHGYVLFDNAKSKIDNPNLYRYKDKWRMTFVRYDTQKSEELWGYETWLAESVDLINWKILGKILAQRGGGWDSLQSSGVTCLVDTVWGGSYEPEKFDGYYWMNYIGGALCGYESDPLSLGMAYCKSLDNISEWSRLSLPVLSSSDADARAFEQKTLYKGFVYHDKKKRLGAEFIMYYNAKKMPYSVEKIGMAVSDDMRSWRRFGKDAVIEGGCDEVWNISGNPQIITMGDLFVMNYFVAHNVSKEKNPHGYTAYDTFAVSKDLVNWAKWNGSPLIEPSEAFDNTFAHKPCIVLHNNNVYHFYCAVGEMGRGIAVATSSQV